MPGSGPIVATDLEISCLDPVPTPRPTPRPTPGPTQAPRTPTPSSPPAQVEGGNAILSSSAESRSTQGLCAMVAGMLLLMAMP